MTQQYLRAASLVVGDGSGNGLDLSALRLTFGVTHSVVQSPKLAAFRIYNLSDATAAAIKNEFSTVTLQAGYQGNIATIFQGSIKQVRKGRENPTDTFVDIFGADGDQAYNWATINQSLASGWTDQDVLNAAMQAFSSFGITLGYVPTLSTAAAPRGAAFYGMVKDIVRDLAARNGCSWNISNGQLNLIPVGGVIPSAAPIVINSKTGMIGIPRQTFDGIEATVLLNPQLRPGSLVHINEQDVLAAQQDQSYGGQAQNDYLPTIPSDGQYSVQWVDYEGDTRGEPWYAHITCKAVDPSAMKPASVAVRQNTSA